MLNSCFYFINNFTGHFNQEILLCKLQLCMTIDSELHLFLKNIFISE